jgi:hypothetical protein
LEVELRKTLDEAVTMTSDFWDGFEKKASLLDAAKAGMRAAPKAVGTIEHAVENGVHRTLNYSAMKAPQASSLPMWKQKMMAAGKKPVGVTAEQMGKASPGATFGTNLV